MDLGSQLRSSFEAKALAALDMAATRGRPGRPVDTLGVFLALTTADAAARWDRIWLEFGELTPSAVGRYTDPLPEAGERWDGQPLTATCGKAIRAAVLLAEGSGLMPVPAGVLALCLAGEPTTAVSRALAATSRQAHSVLLGLVQEALVGGSWQDIESVLKGCFDRAASAAPAAAGPALAGEDPDVRRFVDEMADEIEALVGVLNQFLTAETPAASGKLLEQHPELLSPQVDKIISKTMKEAAEAGDEAVAERFQERRNYLDNYRRLVGETLPGNDAVQRYGECPPGDHVMAHSVVEEPRYTSTVIRCELCHVGCLADMRVDDAGRMHLDYFVFPADGCDAISREIVMWAMATYQESLGDLQQQGIQVQLSAPHIGHRPESLRRHTHFTRDR